MTTKRKPYVREITSSWWKKNNFYKFYMLRESTAIFAIWFCLVLLYGVFCLKDGLNGLQSFILFLRNPIVIIINIISLAAAILHTKTWFELAPKATNIIRNNKKMDSCIQIKILWGVTVVASIIILLLALL